MSDELTIDIKEALRAAVAAMRAHAGGASAGLIAWLQTADFEVAYKAGVIFAIGKLIFERGAEEQAVKLASALMSGSYEDSDLDLNVKGRAVLMRIEALNRLGRYDEAWRVSAKGIAAHANDAHRADYLHHVLGLGADSLSKLGELKASQDMRLLSVMLVAQPDDQTGALEFAYELCRLLLTLEVYEECVEVCVDLLASALNRDDRDARRVRAIVLGAQASALIALERYRAAVEVTHRLGEDTVDARLALDRLSRLLTTLQARDRWNEALTVLDELEIVARRLNDSNTRGRLGFFEITKADILTMLGEPDDAAELREHAREEYGGDIVAMCDARAASAALLPEPERSWEQATALASKAHVLAAWDEYDDRLDETLDLLSKAYSELPDYAASDVRDIFAEAQDRWPDHFS